MRYNCTQEITVEVHNLYSPFSGGGINRLKALKEKKNEMAVGIERRAIFEIIQLCR